MLLPLHFTNEALCCGSYVGGMGGLCIVVVKMCRRIVSCGCAHTTEKWQLGHIWLSIRNNLAHIVFFLNVMLGIFSTIDLFRFC
jgi:hypothetical protein